MNRREFMGILSCGLPAAMASARGGAPAGRNYLNFVRGCAETLLNAGLDRYGPRKSPLWAGVIDARDLSVPRKDIPESRGVRPDDRAVGGCNLYHDAVTLRVMRLLAVVSGERRYAAAAREYIRFYLENAQNPITGFLGWGEHLYYDLFRDQVAAERKHHELLEWTPPWEELWPVHPEATRRAIAALRHHFYSDDPSALFNRHAWWDRAEHQQPQGQPWIKHSGLYAYSFMFLFAKTRDPLWFQWAQGAGTLYWNHRNPATNLTLGCIGNPRPLAQNASAQMPELAYWLLKAWLLNREAAEMRERAIAYMRAYNRHFWDPAQSAYRSSVGLDGRVLSTGTTPVWDIVYGDEGILPAGRVAAFFARVEGDAEFTEMARRVARMAAGTELPPFATLQGIAFALNLCLDLYDLERKAEDLVAARRYAELAIERFWVPNARGGLFVRQPGDRYYEAKLGCGDLLAGLLRLHLRLDPAAKEPPRSDWSY